MADAKKQPTDAELAAAFGANKGTPAAIDMPGDGSGPRVMVSPKPGADLEPVKAPEPTPISAGSGEQRFVVRNGSLVAEAPVAGAKSGISEPVDGGRYLVGGVLVNHAGEPIKDKE